MSTGKIIAQLRKEKNWSQTELANESGISRVMIGKYERDEASPSIDAAKKIADSMGVSLDALVGQDKFSGINRATIKRIEEMEQLDIDTKHHLFFLIDNVIQNYKTKKAFG